MKMKPLVPATLCALLAASPFAMAQETQDAAATASAAGSPPASDTAQPGTEAPPTAPSGMGMSRPGMLGGQPGRGGPMIGGGMMQSGKGCGMGMGGKGMMGGMQQGTGSGGMGRMGCGGKGHGMPDHYKRLMARLDLLDARMAKMEAMLERLLER